MLFCVFYVLISKFLRFYFEVNTLQFFLIESQMYTQLIKRSRTYLDFNKHFDSHKNLIKNASNKEKQESQLLNKTVRQSSRSLLLTKKQLQQLIILLHTQNVVLRGIKNPLESQTMNERLKRQQKQKDRLAEIQQLKFKLQMSSKSVKHQSKRIQDLKFQISVCEEYLKQKGITPNLENEDISGIYPEKKVEKQEKVQLILKKSKNQEKSQRQNHKIQRGLGQKNRQKHDDAIIELIQGFEYLNKQNELFLGQFNDKQSPSPKKDAKSPKGLKFQQSMIKDRSIKNIDEESSSLIETQSFMVNYKNRNQGFVGISGQIREMLKGDEGKMEKIKKDDEQLRRLKDQVERRKIENLQIQRVKDRQSLKVPSQCLIQSQTNNFEKMPHAHNQYRQFSNEEYKNKYKQNRDSDSVSFQKISQQRIRQGQSINIEQQLLDMRGSQSEYDLDDDESEQKKDNDQQQRQKEQQGQKDSIKNNKSVIKKNNNKEQQQQCEQGQKEQKKLQLDGLGQKKVHFLNVLSKFNNKSDHLNSRY